MELKSYESPELEILFIDNIDVITASPSMGGSGPADGGDNEWGV